MRKSTTDEQSPAFQFYASDWISDPNRMKLSLEEQGAYVLLYCHCWRSFRIPKDIEVMSRMCNCRTDKLEKIWKNISHLFEEKKDKEDLWLQGISQRNFIKQFQLHKHLIVDGANLNNGILTVSYHIDIPEAEKPKQIKIKSN